MGVSLTINVAASAAATLDEIAAARDLSREALVEQALAEFLAFEAEQLAKIQEGKAAADRGDFATDEEVEQVFSKYRIA